MASTSSASCSPRWIVRPQSRAIGANYVKDRTQQQCLEKCVADLSCVAVDWDVVLGCWIHDRHREREYFSTTTQFEIVRQCNPASGS